MRNCILITLFLLACVLMTYGQNDVAAEKGRNVCYYTNWAAYRAAEKWKFNSQKINPYLCTHLIYAFAKVEDDATIAPFDPWQDIDLNGYTNFIDLREKYNENLKCLLAIGGYRAGATQFTPISASPSKRETFAMNSLKYLQTYGFDGLNIDWQFPNDQGRNGAPEDYDNFVLLLQDINKIFKEEAAASGEPKKLLTISVPGNILMIQSGYDMSNLQKYTDFINILAYDYHLAFDPDVGHHSALYPLPEEVAGHANEGLNVDATVNYILSKGVPANKLNLGIPLYGRSFTLEDKDLTALGSPAIGQGEKGKFTREDGFKAYYEICSTIEDGWTVEYHNKTAMGPYAYKDNQWVGYDDEDSVRQKGEYAKRKGLGGLSFWSIDQDDFLAECGKKAFPLIKAARESFLKAKGPESKEPTGTSSTVIPSKTTQDSDTMSEPTDLATPSSMESHRKIRPPTMKFVRPVKSSSSSTEKTAQEPPKLPPANQPMLYVPFVPVPVAFAPVAYFPVVFLFPCLNFATQTKEQESDAEDEVIDIVVKEDEEARIDITPGPTTSKNVPGTKETGSSGFGNLILNIYNWGTNYIFSHSPPQNVVGAAQMHRTQNSKQKTTSAHFVPDHLNKEQKWAGEVDIATVLDKRQEMPYRKGNPVWS